jgi:hypothetical protein
LHRSLISYKLNYIWRDSHEQEINNSFFVGCYLRDGDLSMGLPASRGLCQAARAESGNVWAAPLSRCHLAPWTLETPGRRMGLGSRPLEEKTKAPCHLGSWTLGTERKGLGLEPGALGISIVSSEFGVRSSE